MAKKIASFIFLVHLNIFLFGQDELSEKQHSVFVSYDQWFADDLHSVYGYQFTNGKHHFLAGISLERKRLFQIERYYDYNYLVEYASGDAFTHPYLLKDTSFSLRPNCLKLGYHYVFKPENRLTAYPFVNLFINYYNQKGQYEGTLSDGFSGIDHYYMSQWFLGVNLGCGFRYMTKKKFSFKMEFGIGNAFLNNYYKTNFYGVNTGWEWWVNGFGSLGVYYRLK